MTEWKEQREQERQHIEERLKEEQQWKERMKIMAEDERKDRNKKSRSLKRRWR